MIWKLLTGALLLALGLSWGTQTPLLKRHPNIVAIGLSDQRVVLGDLNGMTLCNYYGVVMAENPKTKKQEPQMVKGGAVYGGTGCLDIKSPILWQEKLTPGTPAYIQIVGK